ncbi:binary toxin-like calcium binding domain-containing protein, partial [Bacillus cereus]
MNHPNDSACISFCKTNPNDPVCKLDCLQHPEDFRCAAHCFKSNAPECAEWDSSNPLASKADNDDDGIMNKWETTGFTIDHSGHVVPWKPEWEAPQYNLKKYVSNPFKINTAGDPYTDLQKAIGDMNVVGAIDPTAKHPFVAACPS